MLRFLKKNYLATVQKFNRRQTSDPFLSLKELLDSCPDSIESLEIYDFNIRSFGADSLHYSLKKLSIHSNIISQLVYTSIPNSLPDLKYFTIDLRDDTATDNITLNNKDLYRLEVSVIGNRLLLLNNLKDKTSHYYRVGAYKGIGFHSALLNIERSRRLVKKVNSKKNQRVRRRHIDNLQLS